MANQDALEVIKLRNNFYRDGYRKVLATLLVAIVINIMLLSFVYYLVTHRPKPEYFATTSDGKVIRLYALSEPVVSTSELLQWAAMAATDVNTYNFVTYRKELQDASEQFTPTGWKEFQKALKESNNLQTVIDKKLTVNAVATGAPVILDQGIIDGVYKWKIQLPILITYESASTKISQPVVVTMLVTRVSTLDTPKGVAIDAFYMSEQPLSQAAVNPAGI